MPRAMGWTAQDQGKQGALGKESLRKEGGWPSRGRGGEGGGGGGVGGWGMGSLMKGRGEAK